MVFLFHRYLEREHNEQIRKIIPHCMGYLACLCGSCTGVGLCESECKLFLKINNEKLNWSLDHLMRGFWCSKCDQSVANSIGLHSLDMHHHKILGLQLDLNTDYVQLLSIFFDLLYDNSSEEVQISCVEMIRRVLAHGTTEVLLETRSVWIKCIDFLLFHRNKAVRDAFNPQIGFFLEDRILNCLFLDEETGEKTKEQKFLDKIKHALAAADDPHLYDTLLEATSEIMNTVDTNNQLFLFSLILLVDQLDNPHVTVRMTASRLIHRSCSFHFKGGLEVILNKVAYIRDELYDYLCIRLTTRPEIVNEFAVSVLSVEMNELVKRLIPVVLPKLITIQHSNDLQVVTLNNLAKCLDTDIDMVKLIVDWIPKVLAFALHQADRRVLESALLFYHEHAKSDKQEIFAAALPALLDELVCFVDQGDSDETSKRYVIFFCVSIMSS